MKNPSAFGTWTALLAAFVLAPAANAQLAVSTQTDLQQLAQAITGPGVLISNPTITCHSQGYGEFTYSGSGLSVTNGVILTTGRMTDALGPNNNGGSNWFAQNTPGDPLLDAVTGRTTRDACKFEFDIIPSGDSLQFDFVFASEEYNEWVGSQFNDVFGFFISGPGIVGDPGAGGDKNIALVPGTSTAVTINNVNNGSNSAYYEDNTGGSETQYDGYTVGLSAKSMVTPCEPYHLKLIVADATDRKFDSGVFIDQVSSPTVTMSSFTLNGKTEMVEGCNPGWVRFTRTPVTSQPLVLQYFLQGTAVNGTDYTAIAPIDPLLPKTITIPANQAFVDRLVDPVADALHEPVESVKFILGNPNCPGQDLDSLVFNIRDTILATVTPLTATICQGDSVQYTISGGTTFQWSPAGSLDDATSATPWASPTSTTMYTVQINDGVCSRTYNRLLRVSELALSAVITNPLCAGNSNGAINLSHTGGLAPYQYSWTGPGGFTASTQDISGLVAGSYTVTVTDVACTRTQSFNLIAPSTLATTLQPAILAFGQNIACSGGSTGSIDATVSGGTGPYTTIWTGPNGYTSAAVDITGLAAGAYTLNVTDANGCTTSANTNLTQTTEMEADIASTTSVVCFGDGLGSATVSITGGVPPYNYAWNSAPVQSTATATGLPAANYTVTVTDGYGCSTTAIASVTGPAQALNAQLTAQANVLCTGSSTGSASANANGGTAPYTYSWNTAPVQNTAIASNLAAGTWTCTVSDANGCSTTINATITQPTAPVSVSLFAQTNVLCFGNSTGSATANATGGVGPFNYTWNTAPVQNGATAINLTAGSYTCTATDVNGCTSNVNVTITEPTGPLTATISASTDVDCFGASTGSASINVSGGAVPYAYSWNSVPAQNAPTMSNVPAGTYTCTVTDANGCTIAQNVTIAQPAAALGGSVSAQTNVLCTGNSTGSATVSAVGGTPMYTYSWNTVPVQTTANATGLVAGSYTCTISDANGCSIQRTAVISEPTTVLSASIAAQTNAACFGTSTGSATVNANGGTGAYSFSWNTIPVQTSATATDLPAGTWTCTVADANGCTAQTSTTITQPGLALSASLDAQTNVSCFGASTGSASVGVAGGTAPYSYLWNTIPAQNAATASGLGAGTYTCTVSDANGCAATQNVSIAQPAAPLSATGSVVHAICNGTNNGSIDLTITGGTGPYNSAWTGPGGYTAATDDVALLFAGVYTLLLSDANGCTFVQSFTVTEPGTFTISATPALFNGSNISCNGGNDGSIAVSASGGTPNYIHAWTGPNGFTAATEDIGGLEAGTYVFILTDANGCQAGETVTLIEPAALGSSAVSMDAGNGFQIPCFGGTNGSIDATVAGGTAPMGYSWTGPGAFTSTDEDIASLGEGSYTLTVTDANGCVSITNIALDAPAQLSVNTDGQTDVSCNGGNDGAANMTATGGVLPYSFNWNTVPVQNGPSASGLSAGTWTVTLTDANNCSTSHDVVIAEPAAGLAAFISNNIDVLCFGNATGEATAAASGGTGPYSYSWNTSPQQNAATATGLAAGTWTCTVTDANGCTTTVDAVIVEPAFGLAASISAQQNITCFGASNGGATATASGGSGPYTYTWSTVPVQNGATLSNVGPGTWTVSVEDANGCTTSAQVTITSPAAPVAVNLVSGADQTCFGSANGQATVLATGGTAPYTYAWNTVPAQTGATAVGLGSGTWTVTIMDANGCTAQLPVTIGGPGAPLSLSITDIVDVLCHEDSTGEATVAATGGTAPYTYTWLTNPLVSGPTLSDAVAGTFSVVVTDANGCTAGTNVTIGQPAVGVSAFVESFQNVNCSGGNDGYATVEVSGGSGSYTITWNTVPQQFGATAVGLSAGAYTVTITDNNGCDTPKDHPVTITEPSAALTVTSTVSTFGAFNVQCHGDENGWIDVTVNGGTAPYNYIWTDDFGGSTGIEDLSTLTAGNYYLTVTDANGCSASATWTLTEPASLTSTSNITTAACQGSSDGAVDITVNGGALPYTYTWSGSNGFAANTQDISNVEAGVYHVVITDANGCMIAQDHDVNQPGMFSLSAVVSNYNGSGVSCATANNGSIDATLTGGTLPYQFTWSGPNGFNATTEDIANVPAGTYSLNITDGNGCGSFQSWTVSAPAVLNVSATATQMNGSNVSCNGATNGSINATITGGTSGYTIAWSGPNGFMANTEDLSGLAAGTYALNVTDLNGCTASTSVTLTQPVVLGSSLTTSLYNSGNAIACNGGSNGSIDLTLVGGTAPYTVSWTGPNGFTANTVDIGGLEAGNYTATITDANGCTTSANTTLTAPGPLNLNSTLSSYIGGNAVSCNGANDGSIDLSVIGGGGNNTYQWTGSNAFTSTNEDVSGLGAGTYQVLVTDQNGCTTNANFTLGAPAPISATGTMTTAACQGASNGAVDVTAIGGTAPYNFLWSGPGAFTSNNEDIGGLFAGVYTVQITDANGCTSSQSFDVNQPGLFTVSANVVTYPGGFHTSCAGAVDGSIDLTVSGATPPYFFFWSGPNGFSAITEDISALASGSYQVTITDQNGCSVFQLFTITSAPPVGVGLVASTFSGGVNTSCNGVADGGIDATATGGVAPYNFTWTGPNGFSAITEDVTGLEPGTYTLQLTDAVGCSTTASATLTGPAPMSSSLTTSVFGGGNGVSCDGATDGSIDLTVGGGTMPYIIQWTGPNGFTSNNEDLSSLGGGNYVVLITDANGCTATATATLTEPAPINMVLNPSLYSGGYNIACNGDTNGSISGSVSGGSGSYTFAWTGPNGFTSSDATISGLSAGNYTLTVSDMNGCTATSSLSLQAPQPLQTTQLLSDAGNGYQVSCGGGDGSVDLSVSGGTGPYQFDWTGSNAFAALTEDITALNAGTYTVNVVDANGCVASSSATLTAPGSLQATLAVTGSVCDGTDDGAIDLTLAGGTAPYTTTWSGPNSYTSNNEDINALAGGTYTVIVTDAGTCNGQWSATIAASAAYTFDLYMSDYGNFNIPCAGDSTGVIEVDVTGGAGMLDIVWTGPSGFTANGITDFDGLLAGDYTVTITDTNGCVLDSTITLTEPGAPIGASLSALLYPSGTNISCTGASDGSIDLTVSGGTAPYVYDWRGPDSAFYSTEDISGLVAGDYVVVITDTNQCSFTTTITLTEPDSALVAAFSLSQFAGGSNTSCDGSSNGSIGVTVSGGNGGNAFNWAGPNGFTSNLDSISGLVAGTYLLTLTDTNGCVLSQSIDITAPQPLDPVLTPAVFPSGSNTSCTGVDDGSIDASVFGGVPNYILAWSGPNGFASTDAVIGGLEPGTYCLMVTDSNNCSVQECVDIVANTTMAASTTSTDANCGATTGSVDLTVSGGGSPYTFNWITGATSEDIANVSAGTYTVTITDANGCQWVDSAIVNGSAALTAEAQATEVFCNGGNDGSIDLTVLTGSAPYGFDWSNGTTDEDPTDLAADAYTVTITDALGCTWTGSWTLDESAAIDVDSTVTVHGNGYNVSGYGGSDGSIALDVTGGTEPYTYDWSNGSTTALVNGLPAGTYNVTITDANGCTIMLSFTLDQPTTLEMPTGFSPNDDGSNDAYIVHGLEGFPNNRMLVLNRWGNTVFDQLNYKNDWRGENQQGEPLPNGTYFVIITINEGAQTLQNYVDLRR